MDFKSLQDDFAIAINSTGLKVSIAVESGEMYSQRKWPKLHVAVDVETQPFH